MQKLVLPGKYLLAKVLLCINSLNFACTDKFFCGPMAYFLHVNSYMFVYEYIVGLQN